MIQLRNQRIYYLFYLMSFDRIALLLVLRRKYHCGTLGLQNPSNSQENWGNRDGTRLDIDKSEFETENESRLRRYENEKDNIDSHGECSFNVFR